MRKGSPGATYWVWNWPWGSAGGSKSVAMLSNFEAEILDKVFKRETAGQ